MPVPPTFLKVLALTCTAAAIGTGAGAAAAATPAKPVALLTLSTTTPVVGAPVLADGHTSRFAKGDRFLSAAVSYGDGTKSLLIPKLAGRVSHAYAKPGTYTVTLSVTDIHKVLARTSHQVTVHAAPVKPFPVKVPAGLPSSATISQLPLTALQLSKLAAALHVPAPLLKTLPVGFLAVLPAGVIARPAGGLPRMPGLEGLPLSGDLVSLLPSLPGLPIMLPTTINPFQLISAVPTTTLSAAQLGSFATLLGLPVTTLSQLPAYTVLLLPGNLFTLGTPAPAPTSALPVTPAAGLSPSTRVSALTLSPDVLATLATQLGVPVDVLPSLPVGFLSLLPTSMLTQPLGGLPALPGLSLIPSLSGLPISLPTGLTSTAALSTLPTTVLSATQLSSLASLFGVSTSVLGQLPISSLTLLPTSVLSIVSTLPITLPSGLLPTALISSLGLSPAALSSVSSLLSISPATLPSLPVGVLALLPTSDLTGGTLPGLPGLGGLPIVGNLVGMLLAGLPLSLPSGVNPLQSIGALSSPLSALQLTTLSAFFGIPKSVLTTLPVNVLTLLPSGLVSGL